MCSPTSYSAWLRTSHEHRSRAGDRPQLFASKIVARRLIVANAGRPKTVRSGRLAKSAPPYPPRVRRKMAIGCRSFPVNRMQSIAPDASNRARASRIEIGRNSVPLRRPFSIERFETESLRPSASPIVRFGDRRARRPPCSEARHCPASNQGLRADEGAIDDRAPVIGHVRRILTTTVVSGSGAKS